MMKPLNKARQLIDHYNKDEIIDIISYIMIIAERKLSPESFRKFAADVADQCCSYKKAT